MSLFVSSKKTFYKNPKKAHRLGKIGVVSPEGNILEVTPQAIAARGPAGTYLAGYDSDEVVQFGDISFAINSRERFRHVGASIQVDGAKFEIR